MRKTKVKSGATRNEVSSSSKREPRQVKVCYKGVPEILNILSNLFPAI